jgi:hypothetical protein
MQFRTPLSSFSCRRLHLRGGVDETEDVVEDVVGAVSGQKLEGLGVAHGPALLLDLCGALSVLQLQLFLFKQAQTHEKSTADNDKDAARLVAGLSVNSGDLVLNTLERKLLCSHNCISLLCPFYSMTYSLLLFAILVGWLWMILSYLELVDDVGGTEERRLLKGEHGVVALCAVVSLLLYCPTL